MDDELRKAFATLSSQMSDIGTDARQAAAMAKENAHATTMLGVRIQGLEVDVGQLKTVVFGSNPPPAPVAPVVKRITNNEGETAELAGQLMAVKAINEEQSKKLTLLETKTDAQTAMLQNAFAGFIKTHPQLATAFVGFVCTLLGFLTSFLSSKGHP